MALTPQDFTVNLDENLDTAQNLNNIQTSRTWRLDSETGRISNIIEGREAIIQFIRKILATYRNRYLIYTDEYGCEIKYLIGQNLSQAIKDVEIPRVVREALLRDNRISSVPIVNVDSRNNGDVFLSVSIVTIEGLLIDEEVQI